MKKVYDKPQIGLKHFKFIDRTNAVEKKSSALNCSGVEAVNSLASIEYTKINGLAKS
jgi:hypothetical protein